MSATPQKTNYFLFLDEGNVKELPNPQCFYPNEGNGKKDFN